MRSRLIAFVFISTFIACSLLAATIPGSFQQIDCEGGGWFEQVIPHVSGRIYGRTDVGGMYRSDNHGDTWQFISGDLPSNACYYVQGVAAVPSNPDIVYQATGVSYYDTRPGPGNLEEPGRRNQLGASAGGRQFLGQRLRTLGQ